LAQLEPLNHKNQGIFRDCKEFSSHCGSTDNNNNNNNYSKNKKYSKNKNNP